MNIWSIKFGESRRLQGPVLGNLIQSLQVLANYKSECKDEEQVKMAADIREMTKLTLYRYLSQGDKTFFYILIMYFNLINIPFGQIGACGGSESEADAHVKNALFVIYEFYCRLRVYDVLSDQINLARGIHDTQINICQVPPFHEATKEIEELLKEEGDIQEIDAHCFRQFKRDCKINGIAKNLRLIIINPFIKPENLGL
ncbi:MAG: hypothetical protein EZS28_023802 [Streblomastix strix]|uniref:Uncharacterized protein n=1 Tax=Streblomastix strix TaxID=222440 RepID=A0A5J4VDN4_9EUKA|nr:MAG: hypothetical protein EZS28_023802 [Streblomastix strix]